VLESASGSHAAKPRPAQLRTARRGTAPRSTAHTARPRAAHSAQPGAAQPRAAQPYCKATRGTAPHSPARHSPAQHSPTLQGHARTALKLQVVDYACYAGRGSAARVGLCRACALHVLEAGGRMFGNSRGSGCVWRQAEQEQPPWLNDLRQRGSAVHDEWLLNRERRGTTRLVADAYCPFSFRK